VSLSLEAMGGSRLRIFLTGKNKDQVALFVINGHAVGERILSNGPSRINAHGFVDPRSGGIRMLVA
jgi:hypothetical protein